MMHQVQSLPRCIEQYLFNGCLWEPGEEPPPFNAVTNCGPETKVY